MELSPGLQACQDLLNIMTNQDNVDPFLEPVDWKAFGLTDYPEIITEPMDLGTVETKLTEGKYTTIHGFAYDVRLVWKNSMTYNRPDSDIYETADQLGKLFEKKFAKIVKEHDTRVSDGSVLNKAERHKFSRAVNELSNTELGTLVDMILKNCPSAITEDEEDLEIEINHIDNATFNQLNEFVQDCVGAPRGKKRKKK